MNDVTYLLMRLEVAGPVSGLGAPFVDCSYTHTPGALKTRQGTAAPGCRHRANVLTALLMLRHLAGAAPALAWLSRRVRGWERHWALPPTVAGRHRALLRALFNEIARIRVDRGATRRRATGLWL